MRFTTVILSALFCLNAYAAGAHEDTNTDEDIVAAAEKLVTEGKNAKVEGKATATATATDATAASTKAADAVTDASLATAATALTDGAAQDTRKESEIPLFTKSDKVAKSESSLIWRLVGSIAFIGVVGGALIFASRRWKREKNKGGEKARIEVLHQFHMGPKRSVALIRVAGEALLIGCTDHSVNMLKSVTLIDEELEGAMGKDFNGFLDDEFSIEDVRSALQPRG